MIGMDFSKRIEGALPWPARVIVAVALAALLALAGCAAEEAPSDVETPAPEAVEDVSEQNATGVPAEPEQGAQAPETEPAASALEGYSWDELSRISAEIAAAEDEDAAIEVAKQYELCTPDGRLDGTQVKSVTLSDGTQTTVQIVGFAHDNKTEGGKAGITFIFGDAIKEGRMNENDTSEGGWEDSLMRIDLAQLMESLPSDLKSTIVPVDKLTNNVGKTTDVSAVSVTSDYLWLFSYVELGGEPTVDSYNRYAPVLSAEGSQYKLFADYKNEVDAGTNDDSAIYAKTYKGESCNWWERSARGGDDNFFNVTSGPGNDDEASDSLGVVPGFCI